MGNGSLSTAKTTATTVPTHTKTWLKFCLFKYGFEWQRFLEWEINQFLSCFFVFVCVWVCVNIDNDMNAKGEKSETILLKIMATVLLKDTFKRVYFISIKALFGINETIDFPFISFFLLTIYFFKHSDVESSQLLWD